ncbi:hypothetical protein [Flavobacterium sp. Root420]|uniref:hypothetical protein n=1 Tax=Flavobacterium sp. Root420 TaxID=1736533 RepID=UPI0006FEC30F|nr:hypothetical protein [Flavobacterium sp. Root420]KQX15062.1 hypothetical protein ASC72_17880 [Flavobacterium sp. Root420]
MVKKKINIILIIIVLVLWGSVFYKTINQYFFAKEIAVNTVYSSDKIEFNQINKDTFALEKVSRDPFLNKQTHEVVSYPKKYHTNNTRAVTKKAKTVAIQPRELIVWPPISYHGYIKDSRGELVIIKINQKIYRLRKDALIQGIILKKISSDSLELDFNKERKIIKRFKI